MQLTKQKKEKATVRESCCGQTCDTIDAGLKKVAIVGNPNVGKSVLFNYLTKHYVVVSNYPGTSVEVSRGTAHIDGEEIEVIDTPGIYSMSPITEEERVARKILLDEELFLVVHVIDAKNLERMLPFTLQLLEARLPLVLVLNMMDEARKTGVKIDMGLLEKELGIPVIGAVSTTGEGVDILKRRMIENER
jgi:ferrous iron transport protein B